ARKAVELDPGSALFRLTLARTYGTAGLYASFHGELDRALALAPGEPRVEAIGSRLPSLAPEASTASGAEPHGSPAPLAQRNLTRMAFPTPRRGLCLPVDVTTHEAESALTRGAGPLRIVHHGEELTVSFAGPVARPIPPAPERQLPTQP